MPARVHVVLTPHQRAALLAVLSDYLADCPGQTLRYTAADGEQVDIAGLIVPLMDGLVVESED